LPPPKEPDRLSNHKTITGMSADSSYTVTLNLTPSFGA
jgi:hypothetical protein